MTEAEWQECADPDLMLKFLRGKISGRQLRLFGVACCRRIEQLLPGERSRRAVEVAALLADGLVTEAEAETAGNAAAEAASEAEVVAAEVGWRAAKAAEHLLPLPEEAWMLQSVWEYVAVAMEGEQFVKEGATPEMLEAWSEQSVESGRTVGWTALNPDAIVADILREVIGPIPFRKVAVEPAILAWNNSTIPKLAESIYNEGAFGSLPVLADALEDAGCGDTDILTHLRGPGPHCRGCWVIDALLNNTPGLLAGARGS